MRNKAIWTSLAGRRAKLIKKMRRAKPRGRAVCAAHNELAEIERQMVALWND